MKLIVITGQTATGKTNLAYTYAKSLNGEIINADSRQVYKHLDIISGKDLNPVVRTHLYDVVDPKEHFSSYDWGRLAFQVLTKLESEKKTPVLVGGTYLYLKHLLYGIQTEGIQPDWQLRNKLNNVPVLKLQRMLKKLDINSFNKLNKSDSNNPHRLMRRIEIAKASVRHPGKRSVSKIDPNQTRMISDIEFIGLRFTSRDMLKKAIEKRVAQRIEMGAFEEVNNLLALGYTDLDPGLQSIGYQQLIKYFNRELTKTQAIEQWITREIQYARRQYMFMKKDQNIVWKYV